METVLHDALSEMEPIYRTVGALEFCKSKKRVAVPQTIPVNDHSKPRLHVVEGHAKHGHRAVAHDGAVVRVPQKGEG